MRRKRAIVVLVSAIAIITFSFALGTAWTFSTWHKVTMGLVAALAIGAVARPRRSTA